MDYILDAVKQRAAHLIIELEENGYERNSDKIHNHVHEVFDVLEAIKKAEQREDVPFQIGGDYYFKSNTVREEFDLNEFPERFRKIHETLGRDLQIERQQIEHEEEYKPNEFGIQSYSDDNKDN